MNKIGFKNFRRFTHFPELEFGPITFLVGKNNSGKSTLVKALLLLDNYLKYSDVTIFPFGNKILEDVNIVSYGRAKNKSNIKEDYIRFSYQIEEFHIELTISGKDNETSARVSSFRVKDLNESFTYVFKGPEITIYKNSNFIANKNNNDHLDNIDDEIKALKKSIDSSKLKKSSKDYLQLIDQLNILRDRRNKLDLNNDLNESKTNKTINEIAEKLIIHRKFGRNKSKELVFYFGKYKNKTIAEVYNEDHGYLKWIFEVSDFDEETKILVKKYYSMLSGNIDENEDDIEYDYKVAAFIEKGVNRKEIIKNIHQEFETLYKKAIDEGKTEEDDFSNLIGFYQDRNKIEKSFKRFEELAMNSVFIYLGANSFKQSSIFSIRDINNPLAQTIHEFVQLGLNIRKESLAYKFVENWIQEDKFDIGEQFEIEMYAEEAYDCKIISDNTKIHLADKGMGSVQAMLLILRIACIIDKYGENEITIRVIIEEPELNLHPALQSKLADMFLFVNELKLKKQVECSIEFIIETHSEYIIRRSQVIVAKEELQTTLSDNPFFIYYFPKEIVNPPYRIEYNEDGSLKRNFEEGFFDAGSFQTLELLKIKKLRTK